jgi:hypothetical protein
MSVGFSGGKCRVGRDPAATQDPFVSAGDRIARHRDRKPPLPHISVVSARAQVPRLGSPRRKILRQA